MKKYLVLLLLLLALPAWAADVKISNLPIITEQTNDDVLIINDGNTTTSSITVANFYDLKVDATDGTYHGLTITRTVDASAVASLFGQAMHVDTDGELISADADATTTMPCVCLLVTAGTGASKKCLVFGTITETSWNWTVGEIIYISTDPATTTGLTQTVPSGTGDVVQVVGVALSADTILFNFNGIYAEIQ